MFLVIAAFGYLLSMFVLIFLCHVACGCGDGIRFCCLFSGHFSKFVLCFQLCLMSVSKTGIW